MFLIAYTSLQILNRTVLVLLGTLGGYILKFPQKLHEFYSNVPVKCVFLTMCLGDNLLDPALSGGLRITLIIQTLTNCFTHKSNNIQANPDLHNTLAHLILLCLHKSKKVYRNLVRSFMKYCNSVCILCSHQSAFKQCYKSDSSCDIKQIGLHDR